MKRAFVLCISALLLAGVSASPAVEVAEQIVQFKEARTKEQDRIEAVRLEAAQDLNRRYSEALKTLAQQKQAGGELEPLLAVKKELERYSERLLVNAEDVSKDLPELAALQEAYLRVAARDSLTYWESIHTLATKSAAWLERLQVQLTQDGDLSGALAVKAERDATAEERKVAEARVLVARAEVERHQKDGDQAAVPPPATTEPEPRVRLQPGVRPRPGVSRRHGPRDEADDKNTVRRRYKQFCELVLQDDWDRAISYVDPATVEKRGTDALKAKLRFVGGFLRLARGLGFNDKGQDVTVDDDRATLTPRVRARNGDVKEGRPLRWVKVDGEWYVSVE